MFPFLRKNTPIERYEVNGCTLFVKREDCACDEPDAPHFAKVRGLVPHLNTLKRDGVHTLGYMDTAISMGGWGLAYFAHKLSMQTVIYYPAYKSGYKYNQSEYIKKWIALNAIIHPIERPNVYRINIANAKRHFATAHPDGHWIQDGLRFDETLEAVSQEAHATIAELQPQTIVVNVGSGVMLAGIMRGIILAKHHCDKIIGVLAHKQLKEIHRKRDVLQMADLAEGMHFFTTRLRSVTTHFEIVPGSYLYHEPALIKCPFPCNKYYDLKAFEWLYPRISKFEQPILFWNIGA
jgi:1-aminocyclopropane-1-carboxylate deaminase/D-cysteine desulfhydrase-like pyridoxal-dependent ACC family enzyme